MEYPLERSSLSHKKYVFKTSLGDFFSESYLMALVIINALFFHNELNSVLEGNEHSNVMSLID